MKKQIKRLRLRREILRNLQINNLAYVVGGSEFPTSMECFEATHCECNTQVLPVHLPAR
jgi:hypothetical protein